MSTHERIAEAEKSLSRVRAVERLVEVEEERLRRVIRRLERLPVDSEDVAEHPSWEVRVRNGAFVATLITLLASYAED